QADFSREETIAAVQDFFAFATKMYADKTAFESPAEGGWPTITRDSMRLFGKTDEVVDLLGHLPYPAASDLDARLQLMPAMPFAAFQHDACFGQDDNALGLHVLTEGMIYEHVPPHIVGLTVRPVNDHGVLLDTKEGVVWWHETYPEFKSLTPFLAIGMPDDDDDAPDKHFQEAVDMVKGIYRAHGWPDLERYRKKDCLKAIHIALRDNFP
ncbi:hypothetical protein B0T14DRAFT_413143, partial [Immersiella caudata]